jgi:hypothetical protein
VGAELPSAGVTYYDVPEEYGVRGYRYTIVNERPVLVDPGYRIVEIIEQSGDRLRSSRRRGINRLFGAPSGTGHLLRRFFYRIQRRGIPGRPTGARAEGSAVPVPAFRIPLGRAGTRRSPTRRVSRVERQAGSRSRGRRAVTGSA